MTTVQQRLLTDIRDSVLTITFNRPDRLNAVDRATAAELRDALIAGRDNDAVRAILLTGTGRGFCTGADLTARSGQPELTRTIRKSGISEYTQVAELLRTVDKPVIAAINGVTVGAGLAYAAGCDRRIAAESARFAAIFVRRGLVPDCGLSYHLPRVIGMSKALHMVMTGDLIDAQTALSWGLVDELVPDDQLADQAHAYAARVAAGASVAVELARRMVRRSFERDLEMAIAYESWGQSAVRDTEDLREGRQSFIEKREPRFVGR